MNITLPQLLPHCTAPKQQFCDLCRDRETGKAFRKGVLERQGIEGVDVDFECPKGKPWNSVTQAELTISAKTKNASKAIAKGAISAMKTTVFRKDRVPDIIYKDRLNMCSNCPGNHAVYKNGALFTCGKFADSISGKLPTCGCVLTKKARDAKQDCPMGYWKKLEDY